MSVVSTINSFLMFSKFCVKIVSDMYMTKKEHFLEIIFQIVMSIFSKKDTNDRILFEITS